MHREFCSDLTASSAVNFPIISASLRSVVIWIGVGSIRCTYSGARVPPRFTFTTNLMVFIAYVLGGDVNNQRFISDVTDTTVMKGLPHSKQLAFNREVINPHDGHILCN